MTPPREAKREMKMKRERERESSKMRDLPGKSIP
jgi:hypothetical protein